MNRRRQATARRLLVRAMTRPSSVLSPAAMVVTGVAADVWPLYPGAAAVYGALVGISFLSVEEAEKVAAERRTARPERGGAPVEVADPAVRRSLASLHGEEQALRAALADSPVSLPEVDGEMAGLVADVDQMARRADRVSRYLSTVDAEAVRESRAKAELQRAEAPNDLAESLRQTVAAYDQQLQAVEEGRAHLARFDVQMRQLTASLGAIRGQVVRAALHAEPDPSGRILGQVTDARELIVAVSDDLARVTPPESALPA
jgi:hypothetical protein